MKYCKRTLVAMIAVGIALVVAGCFWREDEEPVEWVERPEAIVVQMRRVGGLPGEDPLELDMPDFTLYGDGTVIYREAAGGGEWMIGTLPDEAIKGLLDFIRGKGFMEFTYEQPENGNVYDAQTTLLYVNAKSEANAVSAYALDFAPVEGVDTTQFKRLQEIVERLVAVDPAALGGTVDGEYIPERTRVTVEQTDEPEAPLSASAWPYQDVDLARLAPEVGSTGEVVVDGDFGRAASPMFVTYEEDGRFYSVGFQPILPYEENFPEFDVPRSQRLSCGRGARDSGGEASLPSE